jgi:hypothetical protein
MMIFVAVCALVFGVASVIALVVTRNNNERQNNPNIPLYNSPGQYQYDTSSAQRRTCQSNLRTVDGAIQAYESLFDNPVYPTSLEDMIQPGTRCLKSVPTCPAGHKPYIWVQGDPPTISCPNDASHTI